MKYLINILHLVLLSISSALIAQDYFPMGSGFHYLKGSEAQDISFIWYTNSFDASGWSGATAPLYYDENSQTVLDDMKDNYTTLYLRSEFEVNSYDNMENATILFDYDDGFVLWINGKEILSRNAPSIRTYNAIAPLSHESGVVEKQTVAVADLGLVTGTNIVAVQVFNKSLSSSDLYFDMAIIVQHDLPVYTPTAELLFDAASGFYNDPFLLTISSGTEGDSIVYTLDGSNPQTSYSSIMATTPAQIDINPNNSLNRPGTPAVLVRASQVKHGYSPAASITHTYIFIENVLEQTYPSGGWPRQLVNDQLIDLDMDPDIVNSAYQYSIRTAFTDIPSISIVTDLENLFNKSTGIYVNAYNRGKEWEKECSFELIDPVKDTALQVNAGLRLRGGNSRKGDNPKHAFRIFFRSEYGLGKLKYPLFESEGTDEFDKIDIRTAMNYSWSMDGDRHNTFLRDVFSRDLQGAMNRPYTRSRYYHLYLNGMYWGLFQTEERAEQNFAESYIGGDEEDYDVIKVTSDTWPYINEATAGNMYAWSEVFDICDKSALTTADYYLLEGKDAKGKPEKNSKVLVDIDNLIDFMLITFYVGNVDAPVSAWHSNNMPNNYFALYNRNNNGKGFVFIHHDAEHSMFIDPIYVSDGITENRVTINDPAMTKPRLSTFNPQWLHHKLCDVKAYRQRFADRAGFLFSDGQALSVEKCRERFLQRKEKINLAIIAESARWGDAKSVIPLTKGDDWLPEVNSILDYFFPRRGAIVINQLKNAGLFPALSMPVITHGENRLTDRFIALESQLTVTLSHDNANGSIYYTVDGSDPRLQDGSVSSLALKISSGSSLSISYSTRLKARVKYEDEWSGLLDVAFLKKTEDYSGIRLTELHYHPAEIVNGTDTIDDRDLEFIEIKNTGTFGVNISGVIFDSAVYYQVPEATLLNPGEFYVIASKPKEFYNQYGIYPDGKYSGQLSNSGEYLLITDSSGNKIISCLYDDNSPWPEKADGTGYSLSAADQNITTDPNDPAYWKSSIVVNGTPYSDDVIGEIPHETPAELSVYPNPTSQFVYFPVRGQFDDEEIQLEIYSLYGQLIERRLIQSTELYELNLEMLGIQSGVYFLLLRGTERTFTSKIIYIK